MGELLAILALTMFSANIILTKVASGRVSVKFGFLVSVTFNVLFASLLVAVQFFFLQQTPFRVDYFALFIFFLAGFFSTYLGRWLLYDSVVKLGPSRASTFQTSNPLFTVLIAWVFLGEHLGAADIGAAIAILAGLFLVSHRPSEQDLGLAAGQPPAQDLSVKRREDRRYRKICSVSNAGALLAFSGAFSYAVGNVLRGLAIQGWNEPIIGAWAGAVTGLFAYLLFGSVARHFLDNWRRLDRIGVYLYAIGGILTISAQICMIAAMRYIPVSIATLITLSTPILVTPLGYFLLKNREGITPRSVVGSAFVLAGVGTILVT